jgi:hypothetical protein
VNCDEARRRLVRSLNPDRQDLHHPSRAPQFTRDSVLPTELDVFGSLYLPRDGDSAELRNEELSRGVAKARRREYPGFETTHGMRRGEQVATDLQVIDSDPIRSRELQDLSLASEVRRTVGITCGAHIDDARGVAGHHQLQRPDWFMPLFCGPLAQE